MPKAKIKHSSEPVEIVVYLKNREPVRFVTEVENPTLIQLCHAMANKRALDKNIMHLRVQETDPGSVYFPVSELMGIDASLPLPETYFTNHDLVDTTPYLHLDIDRSWIEWAIRCLKLGHDKKSTYQKMFVAGVNPEAISELLDYRPDQIEIPINHPDRETILPLLGNENLQEYRNPSKFIELYEIDDFLVTDECEEIVAAAEDTTRRSKIYGKQDFYEGRTSHTRYFEYTDALPSSIMNLQQKVSTLLGVDIQSLEAVHCNFYAEGQQFRAHTDYFTDSFPEFVSRDGHTRRGQRQWSVIIYLSTISSASGLRFQRLGMDFAPKPGAALIWNNLYPSGNPNPYSLHEGLRAGPEGKIMLAQFSRIID